ncbi:hypothetical protein M422DRAFT_98532, partial [Sphaerobolus stellatus SS14]
DSEIILEVMAGAPEFWTTILDPGRYVTAMEFQSAIKYHETSLSHAPFADNSSLERRIRSLEQSMRGNPSTSSLGGSFKCQTFARTHKIGSSPLTLRPTFPKDDTNVSKKATPESKNARPCRHWGSGKHWDYECKHSRSGMRIARSRKIEWTIDDDEAQNEYDDLYY